MSPGSYAAWSSAACATALQRQTLLVYDESDVWRERAEGIDDKMAYVIGCDREGRVRATAAGGFVEADLKRMLEVIEPRPGSP
jgi:hypothetical protein